MSNYIGAAIDLETTGLEYGKHEIVEMSVILHTEDFNIVDYFISQIKPMRPELIDPLALVTNNLKLEQLKDAATPPQVRNAFYQWFSEMVGDRLIIPLGHNYGGFDQNFLKIFFGDSYNSYFYYKYRDTFSLAQALKDSGLLALDQSLNLENLCKKLNIPYVGHNAYDDAMSTLLLYKKLINKLKEIVNE